MRKIALALALILGLANGASAQAPPAIPALPDSARVTQYSIVSSTCICSIGFQIYGAGATVDAWVQVHINGTAYLSTDSTHGWSLSSTNGPLASIARPITNAVLTFNTAQTGTVVIVGDERPSRLSQFPENRGVAARDLNQAVTDQVAVSREMWDKLNRAIVGQPGEVLLPLPNAAARAGQTLVFDLSGNPSLSSITVPGNVLTGTNSFTGQNTFTGGVINTLGESFNMTPGGCSMSPGVRGPLYICNDNNGTNAAGFALGWQVWIGNNPVGSIGANDAVATFVYVDNTNGRQGTWASNYVCNHLPVSSGGSVQVNHCNEWDVLQSQVASSPTNPFSGGPVAHAGEAVCSQNASGTPFPCQAAFWVWAAGDYANNTVSQTQPWNFAFAASRTQYAALGCGDIAGDAGTYFKSGCVWDQSHSQSVIKDSGTHTSFIDLFDNPTFSFFVRGSNSADTNLLFANSSDFNNSIRCSAGATVEKECSLFFAGRSGAGTTNLWKFFKDTSNNIRMTNLATGNIVTQWQNNDTVLLGRGANPLTVSPGGQVSSSNTITAGTGFIGTPLTFATLPATTAGTFAYITDGLAANCGDTSCTTFGTTVTAGGGALKLLVWRNGSNWTLVGK